MKVSTQKTIKNVETLLRSGVNTFIIKVLLIKDGFNKQQYNTIILWAKKSIDAEPFDEDNVMEN